MFWKKKKNNIIVGEFSSIDKIFALKKIKHCKTFVFEVFNWLKQKKGNIAFLRVESKEVNYVIIDVELYKEFVHNSIELKQAKNDIYYIKEIIDQMESEDKQSK